MSAGWLSNTYLVAAGPGGDAFLAYYSWQVYVLTPGGVRRLTGPGA